MMTVPWFWYSRLISGWKSKVLMLTEKVVSVWHVNLPGDTWMYSFPDLKQNQNLWESMGPLHRHLCLHTVSLASYMRRWESWVPYSEFAKPIKPSASKWKGTIQPKWTKSWREARCVVLPISVPPVVCTRASRAGEYPESFPGNPASWLAMEELFISWLLFVAFVALGGWLHCL